MGRAPSKANKVRIGDVFGPMVIVGVPEGLKGSRALFLVICSNCNSMYRRSFSQLEITRRTGAKACRVCRNPVVQRPRHIAKDCNAKYPEHEVFVNPATGEKWLASSFAGMNLGTVSEQARRDGPPSKHPDPDIQRVLDKMDRMMKAGIWW